MGIRHIVDLNPNQGSSFMGLTRGQAKAFAWIFIAIGLTLADPPFSLLPTDFANIWLSGLLVGWFPSLSMEWALLLTYTVIAWGLLLIGFWIYPYNTMGLINGTISKIKLGIKKAIKNPIIIVIGLVVFYFVYNWYKLRLGL